MLPYRAAVLSICKKGGTLRICINFQALNKQTKLDAYLLPRIDDIFNRLSVEQWSSKINLITIYH